MISRHIEIDLDDAAAGMVLAREVQDLRGTVLLPKGSVLNDQMLRSLQRRGIDCVLVENQEVDEAQLAAERERVEQRLARLFRHGGAGRADALLRARLREYRLEGLE